jgi:hypothetical protein
MNFTLFTSLKNEDRYLLEWISYYTVLGFDKFIVVSNDCTDATPRILNMLSEHLDLIHISNIPNPSEPPQVSAASRAYSYIQTHNLSGYCMFVDIDEFLEIRHPHTLETYIDHLSQPDCVALNWRIFGSSSHLTAPNTNVLRAYTHCAPCNFTPHREFKSLFRMTPHLKRIGIHFPTFLSIQNARFVNSAGEPFDPASLRAKPYYSHVLPCHSDAQLRHYCTRSFEEFSTKRLRGRGTQPLTSQTVRHTKAFFKKMDRNEEFCPLPESTLLSTQQMMRKLYDAAGLDKLADPSFFLLYED